MIERLCRSCFRSFPQYNSLQKKCSLCQINSSEPKPRKPLKVMGKRAKEWTATRKQWIADNPSNHQGYWKCYLQIAPDCHKFVTVDTLQVDHYESRARHPELRTEQTNLRPICPICNKLKGSQSVEELTRKRG